jgi:hypothetical protein
MLHDCCTNRYRLLHDWFSNRYRLLNVCCTIAARLLHDCSRGDRRSLRSRRPFPSFNPLVLELDAPVAVLL